MSRHACAIAQTVGMQREADCISRERSEPGPIPLLTDLALKVRGSLTRDGQVRGGQVRGAGVDRLGVQR